MTFLAPEAGILAAALTAPVLALFYFLKLRRRPVRVSSTLLWSRAVQDLQVNAPFRWLRPSLLLLIQLLALAAFVLALARPAIEADSAPASRLVIMIDRSASMSAPADPSRREAPRGETDPPSRLVQAKKRAIELINRLGQDAGGRRAEGVVISFAASARTLTDFTSDHGRLRRAVERIEPTDQPGDFDGALKLVEALVASTAEQQAASPPRVSLFSDGSLPRREDVTPRLGEVEFTFVRAGPPPQAPRDNLGVTAFSAQRDYDQPSRVRVFARLINTGDEPLEAPLKLTLGEEPVAARTTTVPGATASEPGEKPVSIALDDPGGGLRALTLSITRRDALEADNTAALTLEPPTGARVLAVAPDEPSAPQRLAHQMLLRALRAMESTSVETTSATQYKRRADARDALSRYDLIVFDGVEPDRAPAAPSISFGADLPIEGIEVSAPAATAARDGSAGFLSWRRTHPALRHVSLDSVIVSRPMRLSLPNDAEALARGPDGPLIALLEDGPVRRLVIGFSLAHSTWPLQTSFAIFIANAVEHLARTGGDASGRAFRTDEPIAVRGGGGGDRVIAEGPITVEAPVDERGSANLGVIPIAGVYRVDGASPRDRLIAVNLLDPVESAIATANEIDAGGERVQAGGLGVAAPREIWRWFVLAGFGLLALEWLFYAWRMRV